MMHKACGSNQADKTSTDDAVYLDLLGFLNVLIDFASDLQTFPVI